MCFNTDKFLCCLPLWFSVVVIGVMAIGEAVVSLVYLRSIYLIFTCIVEAIMMVLLAAHHESSCYRRSVFFGYIATTLLKFPLIALAFVANEQARLEGEEISQQASLELAADATLGKTSDYLIPVLVGSLTALLLVKVYLTCILLLFGRQRTDRVTQLAENIVHG